MTTPLVRRADYHSPKTERALSWGAIADQVWDLLMLADEAEGQNTWPLDYYLDDAGALFLIASRGGKLYRVELILRDTDVFLGDWIEVREEFTPVAPGARSFTVTRMADGRHRWLMIAATAVLNRVGEIDSMALFDSFIRRAKETGKYPRLDFYHLGESDPALWEFGTADYLARDGVVYIASGVFDEEHPLAQGTIRAAKEEPGVWGASIEFRALRQPELVLTQPEVRIPVYRDGENTRISVVLESEAAGWFTRLGVQESNTMDERIKDRLRQLLGPLADEAVAEFETEVDGVNRTVDREGMVYRTAAGDTANPAPVDRSADTEELPAVARDAEAPVAEAEAAPEDENAEPEKGDISIDMGDAFIELDDEAVAAIAQAVLRSDLVQSLEQTVHEAKETIQAYGARLAFMTEALDAVKAENAKLRERLASLERSDDDKQRQWLEDLPAARTVKVTHRPRRQSAEADDAPDSEPAMADVAERTLSALPKW